MRHHRKIDKHKKEFRKRCEKIVVGDQFETRAKHLSV
jgi:hypothetical protein